ncbi:MAG: glycosyltransferase [bacterium]
MRIELNFKIVLISRKIIRIFQKIVLNFSYYLFKYLPFFRRLFFLNIEEKIDKSKTVFVIGVSEIANVLFYLSKIIPNSISVCLYPNKFYPQNDYDIKFNKIDNKIKNFIFIYFYSPFLLGYLLNVADIFFFLWLNGFIFNNSDIIKLNKKIIEYELNFIKSKRKKIIWYFCGDDIRSIKLTKKYLQENDLDGFVNYYDQYFHTDGYDNQKKLLADLIPKYSDIVFNHILDQISYIQIKQYTTFGYYPLDKFSKNEEKFDNLDKIIILHAPSSPLVKGTPLIRAAIKKLKLEGYKFEYIELINKPNEEVLENLRKSHIVLNQVYLKVPGTFGIEALANYCVVLQSSNFREHMSLYLEDAGELIDKKDIDIDMNDFNKVPWIVVNYWEIYDKLKFLLDNKHLLKNIAENGFSFAKKYFSSEFAKKYLKLILSKNGIETNNFD